MKKSVRTQVGRVVSNKMKKTVVVLMVIKTKDPIFGKYHPKKRKFKAHDEAQTCQVGDKVAIVESKPISHEKRWVVSQVLEKAVATGEVKEV